MYQFIAAAIPQYPLYFAAFASQDAGRLSVGVGGDSRAISTPSAATTLIVSPASNLPRVPVTPAGSRLLPLCRACIAPASMRTAPAGRSVPAIHCFRAATGVECGMNQVERAPDSILRIGCRSCPDAMHMWQPACTAMRAAAILVAMPPVPTSDAERPAMASISGVICRTRSMNTAAGSRFGSAV